MRDEDMFPGLRTRQLTDTISWRFYKHWGQNWPAGEGLEILNGDRSGCVFDINGMKWTGVPSVVQARVYEGPKGWISAVYSYPHGIGYMPDYFWEIYAPETPDLMEDVERFDTEEEMEARVTELLSPREAGGDE